MIFIRDSEVGYVIAIQPSTIQDSMSKVGGGGGGGLGIHKVRVIHIHSE